MKRIYQNSIMIGVSTWILIFGSMKLQETSNYAWLILLLVGAALAGTAVGRGND